MRPDIDAIRADFPAITQQVDGKPVIYLDNACMTAKPTVVLRAMEEYYTRFPGCHGRAAHTFGRLTSDAYERSRARIAAFVGAKKPNQLVFTKNTTEAINLVARGLSWRRGDVVLTSDMEHNSNHLPWVQLGRDHGVTLRHFRLADDGTLDREAYERALGGGVRLVSVFHTSNVTGASLPVAWMVKQAHKAGARVLLDASQALTSDRLRLKDLGVDFAALSMHKLAGPTGVAVLYGKALDQLRPLLYGGEAVDDVNYNDFSLADVPARFEAGLQNYAGVMGAAAAADYLSALPLDALRRHLVELNRVAGEALEQLPGVRIVGPNDPAERHAVLNIDVAGIPAEHVARILDQGRRIMVRAGVHCVHSWYHAKRLEPTVRASFFFYNTVDDANHLAEAVGDVVRHFGPG